MSDAMGRAIYDRQVLLNAQADELELLRAKVRDLEAERDRLRGGIEAMVGEMRTYRKERSAWQVALPILFERRLRAIIAGPLVEDGGT